jgi:hypothetical protein
MFRVLILSILLSACSPWEVGGNLWNNGGTVCPDSEYDNGGSVPRISGYCKAGIGGIIELKRNF